MIPVAVFLGSVIFVLYVLLGYPVILGVLARYRSRPVFKEFVPRTVSLIVVVYNGAAFIREKLDSVLALDYPRELLNILVVSDGSTDETDAIVRSFETSGVRLLRLEHGGKPAALNAAIARAEGEILVLTDVRQVLAPDSVRRLIECFADKSVGVVSGELIVRAGRNSEESHVGLYWRYETWIRNRLGSIDSIFGATGPFYSMRRSLAVPIPPHNLLDDVYLPIHVFFEGYRLIVEPLARAYDHPTTIHTEFKRKVRTLAGNYQILRSYPGLLWFQNRMWFHFVSYKFARLLLGYALLIALISGLFLPGLWAVIVTAGQLGFYALAAFDPWFPEGFALKRISSPARTFTVLALAAIFAVRVFFVPPHTLWKETKIALPQP